MGDLRNAGSKSPLASGRVARATAGTDTAAALGRTRARVTCDRHGSQQGSCGRHDEQGVRRCVSVAGVSSMISCQEGVYEARHLAQPLLVGAWLIVAPAVFGSFVTDRIAAGNDVGLGVLLIAAS